ncbi:phosphatase PAP2 family protein [Paenibacillus nasutitermitis]|uniref:Inositol phosphorylceramide synthase n=1 Tax=Paenibacillus nasutitermitis TaxID=1652958 RepID=A0A917DSK7_9BACL|nr:phosphatase PAP2 family protein [Paenibacillus nasutitermitis]GGD67126.1 inositol phosphorylceramide synthase [Paenibacillus nasutitermitis]
MKTIAKFDIKRFIPLLGMLIFPVLGWMYTWINNQDTQAYSLMTDLDNLIPFLKLFVLPYSIWIFYIYICLIYFFIKDPRVYIRCLLTYAICALVCYGIYLVFQTTVPRPQLSGNDPLTRLMSFVYNRDQPYNCFPSIHCFSSYMVMKALHTSGFRNRMNQFLIYGMSSLIICSTLFVKQHVLLDVVAGVMLADTVYRLLTVLEKKRTSAKADASRSYKMLDV